MKDISKFEPDKLYRCKDADCRKVTIGSRLLPVVRTDFKTGEKVIGNRVCPYDRGLMQEIIKCPKCKSENVQYANPTCDDVFVCKDCERVFSIEDSQLSI